MSTALKKLPEVSLGQYSISRLIVGGNPPHGGSHQTTLMNMHMREYFTLEKTVEFLHRCRAEGINTWQTSYSDKTRDALKQFRQEGGEMHFICLCGPDKVADKDEFAKVLELQPIGVAFHGEVTDRIWRDGKIDTALDTLEQIRNAGILVGLSTAVYEVNC